MTIRKNEEKDWKAILIQCLHDLNDRKVIKYDFAGFTGSLILEINFNQGGITDLDASIKRKFK